MKKLILIAFVCRGLGMWMRYLYGKMRMALGANYRSGIPRNRYTRSM